MSHNRKETRNTSYSALHLFNLKMLPVMLSYTSRPQHHHKAGGNVAELHFCHVGGCLSKYSCNCRVLESQIEEDLFNAT